MQTTYRIKIQDIGMSFLRKLKNQFAGQEVEIVVKPVEANQNRDGRHQKGLLQMVRDSRNHAPVIDSGIDIRGIIDDSQYPPEL